MLQAVPLSYRSSLRMFSACLLAWLLIIMPLAPIAPASMRAYGAGKQEGTKSSSASRQAAKISSTSTYVNAPVPQPAPEPMFAPVITATKDDGLPAATTVAPGGTINYTVTINNTGANSPADDATGVVFTDQIDAHTTLVPGSPIAAATDKYNTIGNVQISIPDGATDLLGNDFDPDTGNNTGMTATAETKSSTACTGGCSNNVTINANGSFTYDPPTNFTGTDTFTYTANSGTSSVSTTVTVTVANKIWFINNNAGACSANCDGRLSHPFNSLAAFNAVNDGLAGHPADNDWIFVFESATAYTGPATLRAGQKFIGQDATAGLISLTGFTQPSGTDPIPAVNSANGVFVTITSAGANNGITLNNGNLLRGFTVGNSGGAKIFGSNFGTLTVGNSTSPDVTLNGSGQALSLTTGTLSTAGKFVSVTTTSSTTQGINLAGVASSGAGSFQFGSTTVSGSTTQGISVGTSTANLDFGNTSVTGGTDAISLVNNSAGTRTFGTINTSGNSGIGFLHSTGGGLVSVTGTTTITNPGGNGIDIDSSNANISFAGTTVSKNNAGIGVRLNNNATRTISFSSLSSSTTTGFALLTNNSGTVNVTTGSLTQSGVGGGAASLTNTALGMTFTTVSSDGGVNGLLFSGGSGTFTATTTNLQNNTAIGLSMSSSAVAANFGNTTSNSSAGAAANLSSNTGAITFGSLTLTPDANQRGLDAQNNTQTITSTSGTITTTGAAAVFIDGPVARTPLAMVLTTISSTNSTGDGAFLQDISGTFTVNGGGTPTTVSNSTGTGISVINSTANVNFGNTSVTGTGNANGDDTGTGVILTNNNGGVTFGSLAISPDSGERALFATDNDGTTAAGTITITSGTITTTNDRAIEITGASASARTPLAIALTAVNANGGTSGIVMQSTSGSFTVNGTGTTGGSGGTVQAMPSNGIRMQDVTNITLKNMNVTGNGTAQTVTGSICDADMVTSDNLDCVANIFLQGAATVVFDNLNVQNGGQNGINGNAVSDFSLLNSVVSANGNEADEHGLTFQNLTGTCAITNSLIRNNFADQVNVTQSANNTTLTLNVTGTRTNNAYPTQDSSTTEIGKTATAATSDQAFLFNTRTTATNVNATINFTGVVFNNTYPGNAVLMNPAAASGTFGGTTTNSSFDTTGGGVIIQAQNGMGGIYNITNSEFNRTALQHILYSGLNPYNGTLQGTIQGNTIGTAGQSGSACFPTSGANCVGIDVNMIGGTGAIRTKIGGTVAGQGNTIQQFDNIGIRIVGNGTGNPKVHSTIQNNTIQNPLGSVAHGIDTNIGTTAGANVEGCFVISGNTVTGTYDSSPGTQLGIHTRVRFVSEHRLPGMSGTGTANALTFLTAQNPGASGKIFTEGNGVPGYQSGAACTTPLLFTTGGVDSGLVSSLMQTLTLPSLADTSVQFSPCRGVDSKSLVPEVAAHGMQPLTQQQLDSIVAAAVQRWTATGLKQNQIAALRDLKFAVGDLDREYLGSANGNTVVVDRYAQGKGWFVDNTPMDDEEFAREAGSTRRYTNPYSVAAGRIDLLSAIEHEVGHRLGLVDTYANVERNSIMYGYLTVGERRVPSLGQAANAQPASLAGVHHLKLKKNEVNVAGEKKLSNHTSRRAMMAAPFSGETVTGTIGTLPAGGTVIIKFSVTVNNAPNLTLLGPPRVENQGTVTANGGISVVTDDPDFGGATDKTRTLIDLFNTSTTLASNLNPSNFGDQVTFTATVNETPAQGTADPTGTVNFIDTSNGNAVVCGNVALSGGQAQCQTSALTAGLHNIRADYSGDGNFDPSQSNVVAQTVNACTSNPIVTSTADAGAGSLRDAIATVCTGTTITFNLPGPGPHTIALTSGELAVARNVTINNNSGENITVSGGGLGRVFNINSGKTVAIVGLTISGGGAVSNGGGVINAGTLTIVNSTLTGNTATSDGGAIQSTASATSLTLINTTVSGNTANGYGGGVDVLGGTATIINSTITNNHGDNDNGGGGGAGGLRNQGGTVTMHNTIVAGNFAGSATTTRNDIEGALQAASSNNLIGDGTNMTGVTNGVNGNQVGSSGTPIDPQLGPLADNGGRTQTHALLSASTAIEAGNNAALPADTFDLDGDANVAETLPVDQRGVGFPRNADSADANLTQTVDIGAFELHPSVENISNQSTNEDTVKNVTFNIGDGTGSLISTVTATSSNTTLLPNANLVITGSGGSRNLQMTPASNQNGTSTVTVTVTATNGRTATDTFDLTVGAVNDPPVANNDPNYSTNEDTPLVVNAASGVLANDTDIDSPPASLTAILVTGPTNASSFTLNPDGSFNYTPNTNFNGVDTFTYKANDGFADSNVATATITVNAVNDPPSFTIAANPPPVSQDAPAQTVNNFATNISPGAPNESGQVLTFNVTPNGSTGTLTFSTAPAINSSTGALTYTPTNGTNGTATFNVTLSDNGSNTPPNSNTSGVQSFTITVNSPNASPVVTTTAGNLAYTENAGAVAIDTGLTVTDSDNANLTGATVAITAGFVSAQDTLAFTNQLGITGNYNSGTGVLTLTGTTTVANYQTALRSVTYANSSDNPTASRTITFTATDGISTAGSATRGIAITAVNDAPVNTVPGPQTTSEDTAKVFSSGNGNQISVADVDAGANSIKITLTATNGTITLSTIAGLVFSNGDGTADATMTFTGTLSAVNTALNGMSFNPTADFNGAASLQIVSDDQGFTGTGGPLTDTDTVNITVNAANDPPVVTTSAGNLNYTEGDPATVIDSGLTVTDPDGGNLAGATVSIISGFVSAEDTLAFTNQNGITGNYNSGTGVLTLTGSSSIANYQTALRSVTYANSSENPTGSRTVRFIADDGTTTSAPATKGITLNAVNDAPVNTVPGGQSTNQNTALTFSSGNGNLISVADVDAGTNAIQVTLTATNGTLTLNGTAGLNFGCGGCSGDGTADATMTFQGTISNINTALNGMTFTPTAGFSGPATLTITTNDLGNSGSGGPLSDTDTVNIQVANNISIQDAKVPEPPSGSVNMIFTVTLSAPAPAGGVSVNFATQEQAPAPDHATAGADYTTTSGTVNFAVGEQIKTIEVPVLADNQLAEANETFLVVLTSPVNGNIANGTATGTILTQNLPGAILISELRTSGPLGAGDDFVEIYNNSDSPHTVNGTGGGYGLFKMGATCSSAPVLIGVIPNGTVIPGRGHFLFVGSAYSLANYGGTGAAAGDVTLSQDIENDRNVAIFSTASLGSISSANRLDSVGFGSNVGATCDLFREGNTLTPANGSTTEYTYVRDECGKKGNPSTFGNCPTGGATADTQVNADDFIFADTNATNLPAGRRLGAPGPQNLGSPRFTLNVVALLLDSTKGGSSTPNRVRDTSAIGPNAANGTMSIRRRFQNNTGVPVTKLRIRVVDISTTFVSGSVADVRLLTSGNTTDTVSDPATCTASPGSPSSPCTITIFGTTLETPPAQPLGGGFNASATTGVITLAQPLAPGASINLQLMLGVQTSGSFKFYFNVEALP
jgi:Bacterial Ig domain/Calx-beta domain